MKCAVKNGVHRFKRQEDLHSIATQNLLVTNNSAFSVFSVGYRKSTYSERSVILP